MVREVESLEPELDRVLFRDSEVLVGGEIPLDDAGRDDRVAAGVPEGSEGLKHKGAGVEPAIDRLLAARKDHYTTKEVAQVLGISPDLLRWRTRVGMYPEPQRGTAGRRLFTIENVLALSALHAGTARQ